MEPETLRLARNVKARKAAIQTQGEALACLALAHALDPKLILTYLRSFAAELVPEIKLFLDQMRLLTKLRQSPASIGRTPRPGILSKSEVEIVEVIREAGERKTTDQILALLSRGGPASEGTTKNGLAHLVRMGVLTNRQDVRQRGYGLPDWD
jgi:hypothetical protein